MGDVNALAGGLDTTRLSAEEQARLHRAERQADALAYLTRRGHDDVAVILGLVPLLCPTCRVEPLPPGREHCEQDRACRAAERALRLERRETADA